jgi:hypothetical protein
VQVFEMAKRRLEALKAENHGLFSLVPDEPTPQGGGSGAGRAFSRRHYGMNVFEDLLTQARSSRRSPPMKVQTVYLIGFDTGVYNYQEIRNCLNGLQAKYQARNAQIYRAEIRKSEVVASQRYEILLRNYGGHLQKQARFRQVDHPDLISNRPHHSRLNPELVPEIEFFVGHRLKVRCVERR